MESRFTLVVENVRNFSTYTLRVSTPRVVIRGENGTGKSTLIEALGFCCYVQSFRTSRAQELISLGSEHAHIGLSCEYEGVETTLSIGIQGGKKQVLVNKKKAASHADILEFLQVVTLSEDDMALIDGAPHGRRSFIDRAVMLTHPSHGDLLRRYTKIVEQRTALLEAGGSPSALAPWTEQAWSCSRAIVEARTVFLTSLSAQMNTILRELGDERLVDIAYLAKVPSVVTSATYGDFCRASESLFMRERATRRTLFGAHLDDWSLSLDQKESRLYASRGQKKLLLTALKCAQVRESVRQRRSQALFFLLDDFLTDFDEARIRALTALIDRLGCIVVITCPQSRGALPFALTNVTEIVL